MRVGHEDGGCARCGELPDRAACPRDREIGRSKGRAEFGCRRDEDVVVPVHPPAQAVVVAFPRHMQNGWAVVAVRVDGELVEAARARERTEEGDHGCLPRQIELTAALFLRDAAMVGGHRAAGDAVLRAVPPSDGVGEEDAPRERRRQPVGEAEVSIGLGQRGGQLLSPGRVDHRPGDIAAATEDDVRPPPFQDRCACSWRAAGTHQRAEERHRRPAGKARDLEGVELVPGLRNEPSLDPIRRPGERHADAAFPQRCCDCERRQNVSGCSACGDQGSQLAGASAHRQRC